MAIQIQFRRDTASDWTAENPTLVSGELGYETDTGKFKIGDGSTAWNSLAYVSPLQVNTIDAKGDIIVGTANDSVARLAVGTNGFVLTADSAEATGVKWAAPSGGFNAFLLMGA